MAIIKLIDVKKSYPPGKVQVEAVRGVSISIEKGDFISIAGTSGAGKTVSFCICASVEDPGF